MTERVAISRPDKVLFDGAGCTKADLAGYLEDVADVMLPHLEGRAVVLNRFPDGTGADGFYQKQAPKNTPTFTETETVPSANRRGHVDHVVVNSVDDLRFLANQASLELHRWLSRTDRLDFPDLLVIDLDPPSRRDLTALRAAVRTVAGTFERLGLEPYLLATGSSGFHVTAPLDRSGDFDTTRAVARRIAEWLVARDPEGLTVEQRVARRGDRIFLDTNRNAYGQTVIAPYSPRARAEAPVATPLDIGELSRAEPDSYDLTSVRRRLARKSDPWADMHRNAVAIASVADRLRSLLDD